MMRQAARRSSKSHQTLPRRLQRSRGRRTRGDRCELSHSTPPRTARAPRVLALSGHLNEPRRGAPRDEHHGPLQRLLGPMALEAYDDCTSKEVVQRAPLAIGQQN